MIQFLSIVLDPILFLCHPNGSPATYLNTYGKLFASNINVSEAVRNRQKNNRKMNKRKEQIFFRKDQAPVYEKILSIINNQKNTKLY